MKLICAADEANGIAKSGVIPWHIPEDLARFKALTMGQPCVMGRRTWDSLPPKVRPLPGRTNVVLGTPGRGQDMKAMLGDDGPTVELHVSLHGLGHALDCVAEKHHPDAWVIGGARVYAEALARNLVTEIHMTRVEGDYGCDLQWCGVPEGWVCTAADPWPEHLRDLGLKRTDSWARSKAGPAYRFETWVRPLGAASPERSAVRELLKDRR